MATNTPQKLSKAQLGRILEQVTDNVAAMLKSEEATEGDPLSKANPGEETPAEETPAGSSTEPPAPEASASPAPEASASPAAPGPEGSAPPPEGSGDPAADAAGGGQMDPAAIQAELKGLPTEELKVFFMAAKAELMERLGGEGSPEGATAAPEASAPPPPAPEASASAGGPPPDLGKKEFKHGDGSGGKISAGSMKKSETVSSDILERLQKAEAGLAEVEGLKKSLADKDAELAAINENLGKVATGFTKLLTKQQAMRKSVSGVSVIGKPDGSTKPEGQDVDPTSLTKSEVTARLRAVTASPNVSQADRDLIKGYYGGTVSVEKLGRILNVQA